MNLVTYIELNISGDKRSGIRALHATLNGTTYRRTVAEMIDWIRSYGLQFFVVGYTRQPARVLIDGHWPNEFLRTDADGVAGNNLLSLPEWPYAA